MQSFDLLDGLDLGFLQDVLGTRPVSETEIPQQAGGAPTGDARGGGCVHRWAAPGPAHGPTPAPHHYSTAPAAMAPLPHPLSLLASAATAPQAAVPAPAGAAAVRPIILDEIRAQLKALNKQDKCDVWLPASKVVHAVLPAAECARILGGRSFVRLGSRREYSGPGARFNAACGAPLPAAFDKVVRSALVSPHSSATTDTVGQSSCATRASRPARQNRAPCGWSTTPRAQSRRSTSFSLRPTCAASHARGRHNPRGGPGTTRDGRLATPLHTRRRAVSPWAATGRRSLTAVTQPSAGVWTKGQHVQRNSCRLQLSRGRLCSVPTARRPPSTWAA